MSARRPLIRAPLLVAFVATMSLGVVQLVRNWPEAKAPPEPPRLPGGRRNPVLTL